MTSHASEGFVIKMTGQYFLQNVPKVDEIYALVELITNCDDAYLEKKSLEEGGFIRIRESILNKSKNKPLKTLSVSDAAGGLTHEGLEASFTTLSTNEVSSRNTRGFFGRGSKEIMYCGPTVYKSIVDGKYSAIRLFSSDDGPRYIWVAEEKEANINHFKDLKLQEEQSGLTATIEISKLFQFKKLTQKIEQHYALRDILHRRSVVAVNATGGETKLISLNKKRGAYEKVLIDQRIQIEGYEDVVLNLWKLPEGDYGLPDEYSENGILLKGKFGIHGNTLFELHQIRSESLGFHGELFMPELEEINRKVMLERSANNNLDNTIPIKPDRTGIDFKHPYNKAVKSAVIKFLEDYFKKKDNSEPSLSHSFEELQRKYQAGLNKLLNEITQSLDLDTTDEKGESTIDIIPPKKYEDLNVTATFTLKILQEVMPEDIQIKIKPTSGEFCLESESLGSALDWRESEDGKYRTASICVKAKQEGEVVLEAYYQSNLASTATFLCPKPPVEYPEITELKFKTSMATVRKNKTRSLQLWGPLNLIGKSVACTYSNNLAAGPKSIFLTLSSNKEYSLGFLHMRAGDIKGEMHIEGTMGYGKDRQRAGCRLMISDTDPDENKIPRFVIEEKYSPVYRSDYDKTAHVIKIFPRHPSCGSAFAPFLNRADPSRVDNEKLEKDLAGCYEILTEIYAYEIARWMVWRYFDKNVAPSNADFDHYFKRFDSVRSTFLTGLRKVWSKELTTDLQRFIEPND